AGDTEGPEAWRGCNEAKASLSGQGSREHEYDRRGPDGRWCNRHLLCRRCHLIEPGVRAAVVVLGEGRGIRLQVQGPHRSRLPGQGRAGEGERGEVPVEGGGG